MKSQRDSDPWTWLDEGPRKSDLRAKSSSRGQRRAPESDLEKRGRKGEIEFMPIMVSSSGPLNPNPDSDLGNLYS